MEVQFTPSARGQFLSSLRYINNDNPGAAIRFREKAENSLRRLIDFPESGRTIHEFPDLSFREVVVTPYRFFYRVKDEVIWIVAVWHCAQLPQQPSK